MNATLALRVLSLLAAFCFLREIRGAEADALIAKGDVFDKQLQAAEALESYLPAEKLEPDNPQLLVRIARQYRHLMTDATSKKEKASSGTDLSRLRATRREARTE
jgi:hypothetical protein